MRTAGINSNASNINTSMPEKEEQHGWGPVNRSSSHFQHTRHKWNNATYKIFENTILNICEQLLRTTPKTEWTFPPETHQQTMPISTLEKEWYIYKKHNVRMCKTMQKCAKCYQNQRFVKFPPERTRTTLKVHRWFPNHDKHITNSRQKSLSIKMCGNNAKRTNMKTQRDPQIRRKL